MARDCTRCCPRRPRAPPAPPKSVLSREFWSDPDCVLRAASTLLGAVGVALLLYSACSSARSDYSAPARHLDLCSSSVPPTPASLCAPNSSSSSSSEGARNASSSCAAVVRAVARERLSAVPHAAVARALAALDAVAMATLVAGYAALVAPFCLCPCLLLCMFSAPVKRYVSCCHSFVDGTMRCCEIVTWPVVLALNAVALALACSTPRDSFTVVGVVDFKAGGHAGHWSHLGDACLVRADACASYHSVASVVGDSVVSTLINASSCDRDAQYYSEARSDLWRMVTVG
eukprot:m51a1_g5572 hypothetical protein (288) ;mRNA; r:606897-607880